MDPAQSRERGRKPLRNLVRITSVGLCICAGISAGIASLGEIPYMRLQDTVAYQSAAEVITSLDGDNVSHACAWLEVAGTDIAYPVMELSAQDPDDYFLTHDAWGAPSPMGCPFLDRRTNPDGSHLMVYAHSAFGSSAMFGPLHRAYLHDIFSSIGNAVWHDARGQVTKFRPLCALQVDKRFAAIQQFDLTDDKCAHLVYDLAQQASARSTRWETQAASCARILTLVTCSQNAPRSAGRTLVIFTATA